MLYDVNGNLLYDSDSTEFANNMIMQYEYDLDSKSNFILLRIFKTKKDGTQQFPFVRSLGRMSTTELMKRENWRLIINAGLGVSSEQPIDGILIENKVVKYDVPCTYHVGAQPLTINKYGDLGYAPADASAADLVRQGIVSALCGFCPIIDDFMKIEPLADVSINGGKNHFEEKAQRQIIGQFGNDDYAILSSEGRGYDNSEGLTLAEAQNICIRYGLKFAYCLDGGRSVSTIVNKKLITSNYLIYTDEARLLPSFIVFNGSNRFSIPYESSEDAADADGD